MAKHHGRRGRPWQRLRRQVLAEETVCHLCGRPVDVTLDGRHPLGPTVDHVIPLTERPDLAHERTNLRLAHRRCNEAKGTGTATPLGASRRW